MNSNAVAQDPGSSSFSDWIQKARSQGKTEEEIKQILAGVARLSALDVYTAIMLGLSEEDLEKVELEKDEEKAQALAKDLFAKRSGMTVDQLVSKATEAVSKGLAEV